jgi:hypothetical protein
MKTISVKQVAAALDITPRAVIYRLEKKQLRGTQSPNAFGKQEWRVYPTKEILEGLKRNSGRIEEARKEASEVGDFDFTPEDIEVVEAEATEDGSSENTESIRSEEEFDASPSREPRDWQAMAHETMKSMAEELVRPLGEIIKQQQEQLAEQGKELFEKNRLLEDKERQLKLLPDFQKQAEDERKAAELKELEAEALRKQVAAMQAKQTEAEQAKQKIAELEQKQSESERNAEQEIRRLKEEKDAEVKAIQQQAEESRQAAEEEMQRLKDEKEEQAKAIQEQLQALCVTVHELQKPKPTWWQKLFSAPSET